jgi:hypothetical protein
MYFKNYDFFANEVRVQAERDNIINWSSLSWGKEWLSKSLVIK